MKDNKKAPPGGAGKGGRGARDGLNVKYTTQYFI
nr:MAG TPA: hypothetical protein [Caudoviricetes sp.]